MLGKCLYPPQPTPTDRGTPDHAERLRYLDARCGPSSVFHVNGIIWVLILKWWSEVDPDLSCRRLWLPQLDFRVETMRAGVAETRAVPKAEDCNGVPYKPCRLPRFSSCFLDYFQADPITDATAPQPTVTED
jgi:hypothetical protein